jgi:hydroxymethylbilane synthase
LVAANPGLEASFIAVRTSGDDLTVKPLSGPGLKGLFVREIETALSAGRLDLAIHSAKDLPAERPPDLAPGPVPLRAPAADALAAADGLTLETLPTGAVVATSSLRRRAQILAFRPDLVVAPVRGNVGTRLEKLRRGEFQALILAQAGLTRLGLDVPTQILPPEIMLPAPGQGLLALERRSDDAHVAALAAPLDHPPSRLALTAERAFARRLDAGCSAPTAAWARFEGRRLVMTVLAAEVDGRRLLKAEDGLAEPDDSAAAELGRSLAENLLARGAGRLVEQAVTKGFFF